MGNDKAKLGSAAISGWDDIYMAGNPGLYLFENAGDIHDQFSRFARRHGHNRLSAKWGSHLTHKIQKTLESEWWGSQCGS
jgi:hypothetical protein